MKDLENYFAGTDSSLESMAEDLIKKKGRKGAIRRSVNWIKEKYGNFLVYNGELLIAEGVSSAAGAGAGEMLSNNLENDLLITGGTILADGVSCFGAYGFMAYLERKKVYSRNVKAFAKHMGKFGLAYLLSGILSVSIKFGLTYYLNKEGYSGGEAALLARVPATSVYILLMNIAGYKLGIIEREENKR